MLQIGHLTKPHALSHYKLDRIDKVSALLIQTGRKLPYVYLGSLPSYGTESFIYKARQQTAVARSLAWPARRFTGRQTAAARKHSLCFLVQFPSNCHAHRRTFAKRRR